jgi:hypothetical protein
MPCESGRSNKNNPPTFGVDVVHNKELLSNPAPRIEGISCASIGRCSLAGIDLPRMGNLCQHRSEPVDPTLEREKITEQNTALI